MRHRRRANNISRESAHRDAMTRNLVISLFEHERIRTSPRKAKAARVLAEKMITLGKKGTLHSRRLALSRLGNKAAVRKLFTELGPRYQARSGGYTRVIRLPETIRLPQVEAASSFKRGYGRRLGDGSPQIYLELVEAEVSPRDHRPAERRSRRARRRAEFARASRSAKAAEETAAAGAPEDGESGAAEDRAPGDEKAEAAGHAEE